MNKLGSVLYKLTGSDRGLNRGGFNLNLGRFYGSKLDLKKSDSNVSFRNNLRFFIFVGRKVFFFLL